MPFSSPYRFPLIAAIALLLLHPAWRAYQWATGGEFSNLIGVLTAIYSAYYAFVAAAKAFNTWRKHDAAPQPDGAWLFIGGSTLMLSADLMTRSNMAHTGVIFLFIGFLLLGLFGPWAALMKLKSYSHLRAQGVWGLTSLLLIPPGMFALGIAFVILSLRWALPCGAVVCLGFWAARKMDRTWRLRSGMAALAVVLLCIAGFWWYMRPFNAADDAAEKERNYAKAVEILRPLAEDGNAKAAFMIGLYYTAAMNPKPNPAEAVKWQIIASNNGSVFSAWMVARAYLDGDGVEKNMTEAVKWLNKAASGGETGAQMALGDLYLEGNDVLPQDTKKAEEWLERAGNQGQPEAYKKLYWFYRKGAPGMKPDYGKAHFWYLVWADHNFSDSSFFKQCPETKERKPEEQGTALTFREMTRTMDRVSCDDGEILPLLTAEQIAASEDRHSRWKSKPENFWAHFSL